MKVLLYLLSYRVEISINHPYSLRLPAIADRAGWEKVWKDVSNDTINTKTTGETVGASMREGVLLY